MTYAAVGQATYSDFPALGLLAGAAQQCVGGEVTEDGMGGRGDYCCQTKTWTNATYKSILGSSWQYYNERRVRRALWLLLDPTVGFPRGSGLDQVAYDFSIGKTIYVQPGFYDRLKRAAINYWKKHPPARWKLDKTGKRATTVSQKTDNPCSGGWYSMWRAPTGTSAAKKVINSVPGSEGRLNRNARPALPDATIAKTSKAGADWRLVRIQGNELVPTAWTKSFMDVFAPAATAPRQPISSMFTKKTVRARAPALRQPDDDAAGPAPTEPSQLYERPVFWAGVAVVGVGAYAAYRTVKK